MTKPGHEVPIQDNDGADMTPRAEETQLRLGNEPEQVAQTPAPEVPVGLQLTEKEEARVHKLMETNGLDRGTAIRQTVSSAKASRIIGHHHAEQIASDAAGHKQIRESEESEPSAGQDRLMELLRATDSEKLGAPKDTDETAT